jgi:probable FeS assembly SUF system protein SufT
VHPRSRNLEDVTFVRECEAVLVPDGITTTIDEDTDATLMQVLGGNLTLRLETGRLVRIEGHDADAIERDPADFDTSPDLPEGAQVDLDVLWGQLKNIFDPEIPVDIVELGLVYGCELQTSESGGLKVCVRMTLTAPGCGMGQVLVDDVKNKMSALPGVDETEVDLVFEPIWNPDMMSEAARLELGFG